MPIEIHWLKYFQYEFCLQGNTNNHQCSCYQQNVLTTTVNWNSNRWYQSKTQVCINYGKK